MFVTCLLSVSLALTASAAPGMPPGAQAQAQAPAHTLWLVQPMYPGQDALVKRTEDGIAALLPQDMKARQVIGREALVGLLRGRNGDLGCVSGEARCREPLQAYVGSLGLERVVLVQAGQDDAGYRFRAVSVRPDTGARAQAEAANPAFEKALAGALVKFLSLNAMVDVVTEPPGATVFVDGVKVGTTPLTTEVLPGEHAFRFELASHLPREVTRMLASREQVRLRSALEKVPARLVVKTLPEGTRILVDGKQVGTDAVDQGIQPGTHSLSLMLEGYVPHDVKAEIAPGATYSLEHTMEPTSMQAFKLAMRRRKANIIARPSYLEASYEMLSLTGTGAEAKPMNGSGVLKSVRTLDIRAPDSRRMMGLGLEYGRYGQYLGVLFVGATYYTNSDLWTVGVRLPEAMEDENPWLTRVRQDGAEVRAKTQMLSIRALHPQVRYVLGPVAFSLQAGLEIRGLFLKDAGRQDGEAFADGFYVVDLHASGQATARIFIYEGLYASVGYQRGFPLLKRVPGSSNLRGGLGYAF